MRGRDAIIGALAELDFEAWTATSRHATAGSASIDHICGPIGLGPGELIRWSGVQAGRKLCDHDGYAVDV